MHTHRSLMQTIRLFVQSEVDRKDTVLVMTPMMHMIGLGCCALKAIYLGIPAVLLPTLTPGAVLDAIERFRCSFTLGLPTFVNQLVEEQAQRPRDVRSLRTVVAGGDRVPVTLQERFAALFGIRLQEAIGMTETAAIAHNPKHGIRPGSLGVAAPGVELSIVDPHDRTLQEGATGEIVVRSPANCVGYWNDPSATAALLQNGWLHTGDLGARDREGYLWFKGRKKAIIIRAGSNVSPQEVEEALCRHPTVLEAAVVGIPDAVYGEVVMAFVSLRLRDASDERELRDCVRAHLADYKVPDKVFFLSELPKAPTGKLDRAALKEMLLAGNGS